MSNLRKSLIFAASGCGLVAVLFLYLSLQPKTTKTVELSLTLQEVLVDDVNSETWLRFRFIAPQISRSAGGITYEQVTTHIEDLCSNTAIPYINEHKLEGDFVVISLADSASQFGEANPNITQYFEAFKIEDNSCVWEAY